MLWEYLKQSAKRAVLEGVAEAADYMSQPCRDERIKAPVAVVVSRLEAQAFGEAPQAIPLSAPPAAARRKGASGA